MSDAVRFSALNVSERKLYILIARFSRYSVGFKRLIIKAVSALAIVYAIDGLSSNHCVILSTAR